MRRTHRSSPRSTRHPVRTCGRWPLRPPGSPTTAAACSRRREPAWRRSPPRPAPACGRATSRPTMGSPTSSPTEAPFTRSWTSPGPGWPRCARPTAARCGVAVALSGESSPALDTDRVYVGFGGGQTYALSRATGQVLWHHDTCCSGGGGTSVVVHGGRLYAEAWTTKVLDPATGQMIGTYVDHNGTDYSQPAFAGTPGDLPAGRRPARRRSRRHDPLVVRRAGAAPDHGGRSRLHGRGGVRDRRPGGPRGARPGQRRAGLVR